MVLPSYSREITLNTIILVAYNYVHYTKKILPVSTGSYLMSWMVEQYYLLWNSVVSAKVITAYKVLIWVKVKIILKLKNFQICISPIPYLSDETDSQLFWFLQFFCTLALNRKLLVCYIGSCWYTDFLCWHLVLTFIDRVDSQKENCSANPAPHTHTP